ncbi:MAG: hypothetical protein A2W98_04990 [Bacteroidetes bacterium GWF2_33_38]|nr:MAG: hypothetical protein A2W98_04990 [Bacteroidetes bacterium GWF2_33_38]OFY75636.1 MAG: hypothetical protein A2265_00040 [Bacteroidetes bacterium RIFOXYA12_FULL_33_9]
MKIVLINPPFIFFKNPRYFPYQCLGLLYIAGYLRENGHEVQIIDAFAEGKKKVRRIEKDFFIIGLDSASIISKIESNVDLIGISVPFSHMAQITHNLVQEIKNTVNIPIVLGGVYPSTQPELAIQSGADYLVLGDGEEPMLNILDFLDKKSETLSNSIITKYSDIKNAKSHYTKDVNTLPFPARDLLPKRLYSGLSARGNNAHYGWGTASLITSRGCPYDCEFCEIHPISGYKWRSYSPSHVLREIDDLYLNYNISHFEIEDSNFTLDINRAIEILDGIVERINKGWSISWSLPNGVRIDKLSEELILKIKESNCTSVCLALENGDDEILSLMRKKLDLKVVLEKVALLAKYKINTSVFIIYGYPGEKKENFLNAVKYYETIKKINPNIQFRFFLLTPMPKTKIFQRCVDEGLLPFDFFSKVSDLHVKLLTPEKVWLKTPLFDKKEVLERKKILINTFSKRGKVKDLIIIYTPVFLYKIYKKLKRIVLYKKWNQYN